MAEQDTYPGTSTPEWDEVRRRTAAWLRERRLSRIRCAVELLAEAGIHRATRRYVIESLEAEGIVRF